MAKRIFQALLLWTVFTSLTLLSWGWQRLSGYLVEWPRILFLGVWLVFSIYGAVVDTQTSGSGGKREIQRHRKIFVLLLPFFLLWFIYLPYADHIYDPNYLVRSLRWCGLLLFSSGLLLRIEAIRAQGRQFSYAVAIQDGHQLVVRGPYRWLRHPAYLGVIGMFCGISWIFGRFGMGMVMALLVWLWMELRIWDEEKLLLQEFGEAYARYRQKTPKLIPLVY